MTLNEDQAAGFAKELMIVLAQNGSLNLYGSTTARDKAAATRASERDAEYLTGLYRDLVSGFQR